MALVKPGNCCVVSTLQPGKEIDHEALVKHGWVLSLVASKAAHLLLVAVTRLLR